MHWFQASSFSRIYPQTSCNFAEILFTMFKLQGPTLFFIKPWKHWKPTAFTFCFSTSPFNTDVYFETPRFHLQQASETHWFPRSHPHLHPRVWRMTMPQQKERHGTQEVSYTGVFGCVFKVAVIWVWHPKKKVPIYEIMIHQICVNVCWLLLYNRNISDSYSLLAA